jgi:hypothetical protein
MAFATGETEETAEQILYRLGPLQNAVLLGIRPIWVAISLYYHSPKKGWFRSTFSNDVWERWCIPFRLDALNAQEVRESMLKAVSNIIKNGQGHEIPPLPDGASFKFALSLPSDKDWSSSPEIVRLVKGIV